MKRVIVASGNQKLRNIIEQVELCSKYDGCSIEEAIKAIANKFDLSDKVIDYLYSRFEIHN